MNYRAITVSNHVELKEDNDVASIVDWVLTETDSYFHTRTNDAGDFCIYADGGIYFEDESVMEEFYELMGGEIVEPLVVRTVGFTGTRHIPDAYQHTVQPDGNISVQRLTLPPVDIANEPSAFLFGNGNALFFDEEGQQISEMQRHGLSGVHLFREKYPDASVNWAIWNRDYSEVHENVFDHITRPELDDTMTEELPNDA